MNGIIRIILAVAGVATLSAQAEGLTVPDSAWPRWQTRWAVGTESSPTPSGLPSSTGRLMAASVLGDYYFLGRRLTPASANGGFRATSGLIASSGSGWLGASGIPNRVGDRVSFGQVALPANIPSPEAGDPPATVPYLGFGYTSLAAHTGFSFSADVGMAAQNPGGAWRFGRALFGQQPNLDDAVRNLRLMPVVQLGVRYTF